MTLLATAGTASAVPASAAAGNPYGDSNLVSMFDGRTLAGWTASDARGYDVRDGAIHTTGSARGYLYYNRQQVGTFRWIFTVRQVVGTNHEPTVLFWGTTDPVRDALSSIQFQPPDGYVWDYRPGHNNDAKALVKHFSHPKPTLTAWNQCEVIGNQATGVASMA